MRVLYSGGARPRNTRSLLSVTSVYVSQYFLLHKFPALWGSASIFNIEEIILAPSLIASLTRFIVP